MNKRKTLLVIFENPPQQWGLRGDRYLWDEMKEKLKDHEYPATEDELIIILHQTFEQLTDKPIKNRRIFRVERFSHGGMSSGMIDPEFWERIAIPMLSERYKETK